METIPDCFASHENAFSVIKETQNVFVLLHCDRAFTNVMTLNKHEKRQWIKNPKSLTRTNSLFWVLPQFPDKMNQKAFVP